MDKGNYHYTQTYKILNMHLYINIGKIKKGNTKLETKWQHKGETVSKYCYDLNNKVYKDNMKKFYRQTNRKWGK